MPDLQNLLNINSDTILNSITDGVVVIGLDSEILFINRAAEEIVHTVGGSQFSLEAKCTDVMGHSGCTMGCLLKKTLETKENLYNYEATFERDGKKRLFNINTTLLKDDSGNVIGGIEIFRDVTLIKELEDEIKIKYSFDNFIGKNHKLNEVFDLVREVAPTKSTVLIEGETGTGKELIAKSIHHNSPRSSEPLIKLNCAALSDSLLESELFGHVKGSFTGAMTDRSGRFELANRGTLFLDEVGELSQQTQVKLLRALQEGEFERVGGTKTIKVDVRIIAATNKNLKDEVAKGNFREDLYYRLKVVPITLPPLRERKNDIPLLINHFMGKFNEEMNKTVTNISPAAMEVLMDYNYPGNVRELEHIIEHAIIRCHTKTLNPENLPKETRTNDLVGKAIDSTEPIKQLEKEIIGRALVENNWNHSKVAEKLQMSRTTLWRKIKKLNITK